MDEEKIAALTAAIEALTLKMEAMGVASDTAKNITSAGTSFVNATRKAAKDIDNLRKAGKSEAEIAKKLSEELAALTADYKAGAITLEEFNKKAAVFKTSLGNLSEALDETTKKEIQRDLDEAEAVNTRLAANKVMVSSINQTMKSLVVATFTASTSILKAVQSGGDGIAVANSILNAEITAGQQSFNALSSGVKTTADAFSKMPGKVGLLATGISALTSVFQNVADATVAYEKARLDIMNVQATKVMSSFMAISSTGANFAAGMDELKGIVAETGVSMDTLSKIQKTNAETISGAGIGMQAGFRKLAKTFAGAEGNQLKSSLLNLGFSIEEQGEVVAKTMEQMRRSGRDMSTVSQSDIASSTRDYAENLRTISAITGQDAKAKMQQARDAATNAAVENKIRKMTRDGDVKAREKFQRDYAIAASKGLEKAFLQQFATSDMNGRGGIVTDISSAIVMNQTGSEQSVKDLVANTHNKDYAGSNTEAARLSGKLGGELNSDTAVTNMSSLGLAQMLGTNTGAAGAASELYSNVQKESLKGATSSEAAVAAQQEVVKSMQTLSKTTQDLNDIQIKGEQARAKLEGDLFANLEEYTAKMKSALENAGMLADLKPVDKTSMVLSSVATGIGSLVTGLLEFKAASLLLGTRTASVTGVFGTLGGTLTSASVTIAGAASSAGAALTAAGSTIVGAASSAATTLSGAMSTAGTAIAGASAGTVALAAVSATAAAAGLQAANSVWDGGDGANFLNDALNSALQKAFDVDSLGIFAYNLSHTDPLSNAEQKQDTKTPTNKESDKSTANIVAAIDKNKPIDPAQSTANIVAAIDKNKPIDPAQSTANIVAAIDKNKPIDPAQSTANIVAAIDKNKPIDPAQSTANIVAAIDKNKPIDPAQSTANIVAAIDKNKPIDPAQSTANIVAAIDKNKPIDPAQSNNNLLSAIEKSKLFHDNDTYTAFTAIDSSSFAPVIAAIEKNKPESNLASDASTVNLSKDIGAMAPLNSSARIVNQNSPTLDDSNVKTKMAQEADISTKAAMSTINKTALDNVQVSLNDASVLTAFKPIVEMLSKYFEDTKAEGNTESSQRAMVTALAKVTTLLTEQNKMVEQTTGLMQDLVDTSSDHKHISSRIYRATV